MHRLLNWLRPLPSKNRSEQVNSVERELVLSGQLTFLFPSFMAQTAFQTSSNEMLLFWGTGLSTATDLEWLHCQTSTGESGFRKCVHELLLLLCSHICRAYAATPGNSILVRLVFSKNVSFKLD